MHLRITDADAPLAAGVTVTPATAAFLCIDSTPGRTLNGGAFWCRIQSERNWRAGRYGFSSCAHRNAGGFHFFYGQGVGFIGFGIELNGVIFALQPL